MTSSASVPRSGNDVGLPVDEHVHHLEIDPHERPGRTVSGIQRATDLTGVLVLKHDDLFLLTNPFGDIHPDARGLGLYWGDTRFLSHYELRINGIRPLVLRAGSGASYTSTLQLTNPDFLRHPADKTDPEVVLRRQSFGIVRERILCDGFSERIRIDNFTAHPERCRLTIRLDVDYADIFEVRGFVRDERGVRLPNAFNGQTITFGYRGLDGRVRTTQVTCSEPATVVPAASVLDFEALVDSGEPISAGLVAGFSEQARSVGREGQVLLLFDWTLAPGEHRELEMATRPIIDVAPVESRPVVAAEAAPSASAVTLEAPTHPWIPLCPEEPEAFHRAWRASSTRVETSDLSASRALDRALTDLRLMLNTGPLAGERYIAAGVPWFSCLFGRDAIITALQMLAIRPQLAEQTLRLLGRLQATEVDDTRDAEPGKILHELRTGELAATHEIPHTPYYGTADATPLWLMLLGEYHRWTADDQLVDELWPNVLAALGWIDAYGDVDGDGFVEYIRRSERGLVNQGWKDSAEANRFRDGTLAQAPLALVEVQAYVYSARLHVAALARRRGDLELAEDQEQRAEALRVRFEAAFWMDDVGMYALALDRDKRRVTALSSNPGHVLWCGLASPERAEQVATRLREPGLWSGWGIRTLSSEMAGYNPIGYHIGSVWPHDNAICAEGLARYGFRADVNRLATTMLEATMYFRDARLPELFCGFDRARSPHPVPYPVACSPQAWAAGSLFQLLQAMLGLRPNAAAGELELISPSLPEWLSEVRLSNMRVGASTVDIRFRRTDGVTGVDVLDRTGDLSIVVRV